MLCSRLAQRLKVSHTWEKSLSWQARGGRVKCVRFASSLAAAAAREGVRPRRTWGREGVIEGIFEHPDFDSYRFSTGVEPSFNSLLKLAIAIYRPEQSIAISRNNAIDDISQRSQKRDPHEPL